MRVWKVKSCRFNGEAELEKMLNNLEQDGCKIQSITSPSDYTYTVIYTIEEEYEEVK